MRMPSAASVALFVTLGCALVSALPQNRVPSKDALDTEAKFEQFKEKFDKTYRDHAEHRYRLGVFQANLQRAEEMNKDEGAPVFGVTKFSDLTPEEFKARYLRYQPKTDVAVEINVSPVRKDTNTTADWNKKGAVTPVKDQGQCGSCWAFSCTEQIESDVFLATGSLLELSPQQVVSCDTTDGGCDGGDTPTCYDYVMAAKGLEKESSYPYHSGTSGSDGKCKTEDDKKVATIGGYQYVSKDGKNEDGMVEYVSSEGPLSICVDAESWQLYSGGVLTKHCGRMLDHCVQITGYNKEDKTPYWVVRNSWNTDWGEEGFIYVEMGKNKCGVADEATYTTNATLINNGKWL